MNPKSSSHYSRGCSMFYWILVIGLLGAAAYFTTQRILLLKTSIKAEAVILRASHNVSAGSPGAATSQGYGPLFEFVDQNGRTHQVTNKVRIAPLTVGQKFPIRYQLDQPEKAILYSPWSVWGPVIIPLILGVLLAIPGLVIMFKK